jgi:UrcA family protein
MRRTFEAVAAVICLATGAVSAVAHAASIELEKTEITVRYQSEELVSPIAARILLRRIGDAALESCGASSFSLSEFKVATEHSACWRDAVAEALRHIDSPTLSAVAAIGGR